MDLYEKLESLITNDNIRDGFELHLIEQHLHAAELFMEQGKPDSWVDESLRMATDIMKGLEQ